MRVEVRAEYVCGHGDRVIASGRCRPRHLSADLKAMVDRATSGGDVGFKCPCGRGAAYVEIRVDGKLISRRPAASFLGAPGARLSRRPAED